MRKIYRWYGRLSKRTRDSVYVSCTLVGIISTFLSILGVSLADLDGMSIMERIGVVITAVVVFALIVYWVIGYIFRNQVRLTINRTPVHIFCGDIFQEKGVRVIGCDTHFDTRVDDIIISKNSLQGKMILEHGKVEEIKAAVDSEAKRLGITKNNSGLYDFPLGSIIQYDSSVDNQTYLMLAMTELNEDYEAHTNMSKYEQMLMKMWREVSRVYASNDIVLPILGTGITRFDDGPKDSNSLLRCMLCTLNSSGMNFNSKISVLIYGNAKDISLYEYKEIFNIMMQK